MHTTRNASDNIKTTRRRTIATALLMGILSGAGHAAQATQIASPNGQIVVNVELTTMDGAQGVLVYQVRYKDRPVIALSRLGLDIGDRPIRAGLEIVKHSTDEQDTTWKPVCGERAKVRDRYRRLRLDLKETSPPHRRLTVTFRVYDEGVALCYAFVKQPGLDSIHIKRERTEFRFTGDHTAWAVYSAQGRYAEVPLSKLKRGCERPLVLRVADDLYAAVGEARLVDYARMKLAPLEGVPHALVSDLSGQVGSTPPLTTPWRFVLLAKSPGELLENNDIIRNLNEPCAIEDPSWIRPGKVIREVTLTTRGGKACVDLAVKHNLQFVEYDAGWYGHEYDDKSDATTITLDPKRSKGPLDLHEVIRYAKERNVGILLYVNRRALEKQLDEILPLYRKWGVSGVKYGFVRVGSQRWTRWLHEAIRKAADHRLMVDIHDEYRPTGYSRTYPNLMTMEGIAGDETKPTNTQTLTILFTRMIAGAGDNTICYYNPRVEENANHAYQLAKAVCIYSPWQFLFWYDRPVGSRDVKRGADGRLPHGVIGDEPELEFFAAVPTVWDDTKVLHGKIGHYAVVARRSGAQWFIGCMNAGEPRTLAVPLSFLEAEKRYIAHIYSHDPNVPTRTHVKIERFGVDAKTVLTARMNKNGGMAVRIVPATGASNPPRYPRP